MRLSHKHIVRLHNLQKADENYYLVMEYVEGQDLFVMDRPGTGHDGHLTEAEKEILKAWMEQL